MKKNFLVLMAKAPIKGKVKTRLISWLGEEGALTLYQCMLKDRLDELARLKGIDIYIACYPFEEKKSIENLLPAVISKNVKIIPQKGKDLGERILSALRFFDLHGKNLIFIDTDTPSLTLSLITKAFEELRNYDLLIGPSKDGGYYLIGLKNPYNELFIDIPWGTERVFSITIDRAKKKNLSIKVLPELIDIDTKSDAVLFYSSARNEKLTRTASFLEEILSKKPTEFKKGF